MLPFIHSFQTLLTRRSSLFLLLCLLSSCSIVNHASVEKRRYRPGLFVQGTDHPGEKGTSSDTILRRERKNPLTVWKNNLFSNSYLSINALPMESLRLGYNFLVCPRLFAGADVSLLYSFQFILRWQLKYPSYTTSDYYTLQKNTLLLTPWLKWYFKGNEHTVQEGYFLKAEGLFTGWFHGIKSNYYNKPGIPDEVNAEEFISEGLGNKVYVGSSEFKTRGFNVLIGRTLFTNWRQRVLFDAAIGYHYLRLPGMVSEEKQVDGETFYYHGTPIWDNPLNFPVYTEFSFLYRF